ncbi:hypothetical protein CCACVL1_20286, partial [Corchorus capsularis]
QPPPTLLYSKPRTPKNLPQPLAKMVLFKAPSSSISTAGGPKEVDHHEEVQMSA